MKWIKTNGFVQDSQTGEVMCLLPKTDDDLRDKMIELAPELFGAMLSFVESIESGKFAAKSTYNDLKEILGRVPEELFRDERVQV